MSQCTTKTHRLQVIKDHTVSPSASPAAAHADVAARSACSAVRAQTASVDFRAAVHCTLCRPGTSCICRFVAIATKVLKGHPAFHREMLQA